MINNEYQRAVRQKYEIVSQQLLSHLSRSVNFLCCKAGHLQTTARGAKPFLPAHDAISTGCKDVLSLVTKL